MWASLGRILKNICKYESDVLYLWKQNNRDMKYTEEEKEFLDKCAIAAMQGFLNNTWIDVPKLSEKSYKIADAMLKARKEALGE